jgi:hypothetical protein
MKLDEARALYEGKTMTERWVIAKNVKSTDHRNLRQATREELQMLIEEIAGVAHSAHVIRRSRKKMKELRD